MSESAEEPKLIVDEDWKTQVQREKEEFERKKKLAESEPAAVGDSTASQPASEELSATSSPTKDTTSSQPEPAAQNRTQSLPPASLSMLITSLGSQALASMGLLPNEDGQTLPVNLDFAKHFIDLLGVVEEKTQGNLQPEETHQLRETLYQLRMTFVEVKKRNT
jgi:hypothetical protein